MTDPNLDDPSGLGAEPGEPAGGPEGAVPPPRPRKRSIVELIADIPDQVQDLVQREIELVQTEVIEKLKLLRTGGALILGGLITLVLCIGVLLTLAIIGLSYIMSPWLAAILVAVVLLITAIILLLTGRRILQEGIPPVPTEAIESIQKDIHAIKGMGKRGER